MTVQYACGTTNHGTNSYFITCVTFEIIKLKVFLIFNNLICEESCVACSADVYDLLKFYYYFIYLLLFYVFIIILFIIIIFILSI